MGYIMDLRKILGHRKLLMAGAGVFILRDKQVLLQRRRDNGLWADHGGSVELSERVEDAARRELTEETGLTANRLEFLGLLSGPEMDFTYPNGDEASLVCAYYLCRDFSGEIKRQDEEVTALRWFPLGALPGKAEWSPISWQALQLLLDYLKKETDGFPPD